MGKDKKNRVGEENKIRAYFVRLFGRYDFRNEEQFRYFGKWLFFILLLLVETLVLLQQLGDFLERRNWVNFIASCIVVFTLTLSMALQFFAAKGRRGRMTFYVIDAIASGAFLFFTGGSYAILIYILVLTQFYMETEKTKQAVILLAVGIVFYMLFVGLQMYFRYDKPVTDIFQLIRISFGAVVALVTHFFVMQIAIAFYRQYLKLNKTLAELAESKKELEKAYEAAGEVAVLEERQRIAKEIHDTAGHSITTVIMQTESAKRIIDNNPEEAKTKIVAANLQAKHALDELRASVHLLSGRAENATLKEELLAIIHESTDGTGIVIRSEIEEVCISESKHRFLCNSLREGVSNGIRHGGATAFWFELKVVDGKILFLLSDNGKGIRGETKMGFGLSTMQERARSFGGELTVVTEIEEGFELRLELPTDRE